MILMKNIITCACGCKRVGPNHARNLLKKCYDRLNRKRAHVRYPRNRNELDPKPMRLASKHIAERVADCARLHADGLHTMEIAIQLGVDQRTVWRYLRHLRAIKETDDDQ